MDRQRRLPRRAALGLLALSGLLLGAVAAAQPMTITLGTATQGGGFGIYGEAVAGAIAAIDPDLKVETRATPGSAANVPMLEKGELDLGLVQGTSAWETLAGPNRSQAHLRVVAAMYSSPGMFVVRADSPAQRIGDLRGQRIVLGAAGSGLVVLARHVLEGLGLDPAKDFEVVLLERAGDGPAMVIGGGAAALWGGGVGWPGFDAMSKAPGGARFIGLTEDEVARVRARHPYLSTMTVPAGAYPSIDQPLTTVGSWNLIVARPGLADDVAYRVTRALHRGEAELGRRLAQAKETTAANTVSATPRSDLLHPGTARYLREIGLLP